MSGKITALKEGLLKLQQRQIYLGSEMVRRGGLLAAEDETYSKEGWGRQLAALKEEHSKNWLDMASLRRELDIETEHVKMWEEQDKKMAEMVEADRVLVLKTRLLSEFFKVLNSEGCEDWRQQLEAFLLENGVEEKVRTDIIESITDATEMLREMEEAGKHVPSESQRENVGQILYWARQG